MKRTKIVVINAFALMVMLIILEIATRIFLTRRDFNGLASVEFATKVRVYLNSKRYGGNNQNANLELKCLANVANDETNKQILPFYKKYELGFNQFLKIANDVPVAILYLPSFKSGDLHKQFFSELAVKNSLEFLDLSPTLRNSGSFDTWTLRPEDGHLSRFGNKVVAENLYDFVLRNEKHLNKKILRDKEIVKSQIASLKPSKSSIWNMIPKMAYRVYTNKNGFRSIEEVNSDGSLVIVYGDSMTFGPYLPNHDTFTELANKEFKKQGKDNIQILNAGLMGSTIFHETETLKKTIGIKPNLIVLQVLDNDIFGVSYAKMRQIQPVPLSDANLFKPSKEELKIIENCSSNVLRK